MRKAGTGESFPPTAINDKKRSPCYSAAWDLNNTQSQEKLQKCMNWPLLHEGQFRQK